MSHLSATTLTFSPKWDAMDDDERTAEQVAAYEIVSKCGGDQGCIPVRLAQAQPTARASREEATGRLALVRETLPANALSSP